MGLLNDTPHSCEECRAWDKVEVFIRATATDSIAMDGRSQLYVARAIIFVDSTHGCRNKPHACKSRQMTIKITIVQLPTAALPLTRPPSPQTCPQPSVSVYEPLPPQSHRRPCWCLPAHHVLRDQENLAASLPPSAHRRHHHRPSCHL